MTWWSASKVATVLSIKINESMTISECFYPKPNIFLVIIDAGPSPGRVLEYYRTHCTETNTMFCNLYSPALDRVILIEMYPSVCLSASVSVCTSVSKLLTLTVVLTRTKQCPYLMCIFLETSSSWYHNIDYLNLWPWPWYRKTARRGSHRPIFLLIVSENQLKNFSTVSLKKIKNFLGKDHKLDIFYKTFRPWTWHIL